MAGAVAIIVAHPDDEVLGAGAHLPLWGKHLHFVHVTDGSPRNLQDARANGFGNREDYANQRERELCAALQAAGLEDASRCRLELVDQEASLHLVELTLRIADELQIRPPRFVLTHPYEGGHPDHDATAFAVQSACQLLRRKKVAPPEVLEMTFYHSREGRFGCGEFLYKAGYPVSSRQLAAPERLFKQSLLSCFTTQRGVLAAFDITFERFRPAPLYDFRQPPHAGTLYYEMFDWGMTGRQWRGLANEALAELAMEEVLTC